MNDVDGGAAGREGEARHASAEDAPVLAEMRLDFLRLVKTIEGEAAAAVLADQLEMFSSELSAGRMRAWLWEIEGQVVGSCAFRELPAGCASDAVSGVAPDAEVLAVYTRPGARRRGIASALLTEAIGTAREQGVGRLLLQPTDDSRRIYLAAGFVESRQKRGKMELILHRA